MMDDLKSILTKDWFILPKDFLEIKQKEIIKYRKDFVNSVLKEIKAYYLNKLPKEKTFDSTANSKKESINNVKIYNKCLKLIKEIIIKG